jgi:hypothetical protein
MSGCGAASAADNRRMRRLWLVFAFVVLSTTSARASQSCVCATRLELLPVPGTRDVPRNTKVWIVGGLIGVARLDGGAALIGEGQLVDNDSAHATQQFAFGKLDAGRAYRFRSLAYGPATRFTTGADNDLTPPARPALRALSIAVSEYGAATEPVTELDIDAALDPDVALLRLSFTTDRGTRSLITTREGWRRLGRPACGTELPLVAGDHVVVAISAIDLAGNESLPVIRGVTVDAAPPTQAACARHRQSPVIKAPRLPPWRAGTEHMRCGGGAVAVLVFMGIATIVVGCIACVLGYLAMWFWRVRQARLAMPEAVSLLVAERLARVVQRQGGVLAAVGIVGVPALVTMNLGPLAIVSTVLGCIGLRGFFLARAVLQLIEQDPRGVGRLSEPVTAELVGLTIVVRSVADEARLDVSLRALAAARRHAVPTSITRRS